MVVAEPSHTVPPLDKSSHLRDLSYLHANAVVCPQNMRGGMKKQKMDKEKDRDISEKIALGMHKGSGAKGGADL